MLCRRSFCSARCVTQFFTSFDSECAHLVSRKLEGFPVDRLNLAPFGNGLFATRDIRANETVFCESPLLSTGKEKVATDEVRSVVNNAPGIEWLEDYTLVAQAVAEIVDGESHHKVLRTEDEKKLDVADRLVALRCLGWTSPSCAQADYRIVHGPLYETIKVEFDLSALTWTPFECQRIYDKIKLNYFQSNAYRSDVFVAASMINHSCEPNVGFDMTNPDRVMALRDMTQGDQLFIDYTVADPEIDFPELYGFRCLCERCSLRGTQL